MTTSVKTPPSQSAAIPGAELLDPRALAAISHLELVAKQVMDGYVQGMHKSPHIGFALDFAQHRQYVPGDDIKRIDWRVYAKADRYYIKQYEVTTNLRAHVVVDASGSMRYQGQYDAMSKFRYAQFVAVCLSYLILHQQDSVGLVTFEQGIRDFIPGRSASPHLFTIARALDAIKPGVPDGDLATDRHRQTQTGVGEGSISSILHEIAERLGHRQMVILISDLFDNVDDLVKAFHHLRHKRHEVLVLQVMADDELTFPFRKFSLFENLEAMAQKLKLDPVTVRANYLENVARHLKRIREECNGMRISHSLFKTNESVEKALATYLAQRMGSR